MRISLGLKSVPFDLVGGSLAAVCGIVVGILWLMDPAPSAKWIGVATIVGILAAVAPYVWVRSQANSGDTETLLGMIDISIAHARRRQRDDKAGYVGCGILLVVDGLLAYLGYSQLHFFSGRSDPTFGRDSVHRRHDSYQGLS
jgi:hypothetical protein